MRKIILASASPRRRELLERAGVSFTVMPASGEEKRTSEDPAEVVLQLARDKASAVAGTLAECEEGTLVIGSDTIVVFDRIRENLRYYSKKMSFGEIVDASVNQTLTRSINTSLTTLITLCALYFWGGVTTKDFVLCMILGIAIGTYSSIFFCSMLVDFWNDKQQKQVKTVA